MHLLWKSVPAFALFVSSAALHAAQKAVLQGSVPAGQTVSFNVYLPLQNRAALEQLLTNLHDSTSGQYQHWLTPAQFNAQFAAPAASVQSIVSQLAANNLTVKQVSPHYLRVTGTATAVEHALSTQLKTGVFAGGKQVVVAATPVTPPSTISGLGGVITGLSATIRMRSHAHPSSTDNRYSTAGPYWFDDLKQAYQWPTYAAYTGKGTTIGIVIDGNYNPPDMDLYFKHEKLATPNFSVVNVLGGAAYDPTGDSFETHLDMQQTGGMAPNANIIVYNIPDLSDDSIMAGLSQILEDNKTDVVSMSFGGPRSTTRRITTQARTSPTSCGKRMICSPRVMRRALRSSRLPAIPVHFRRCRWPASTRTPAPAPFCHRPSFRHPARTLWALAEPT